MSSSRLAEDESDWDLFCVTRDIKRNWGVYCVEASLAKSLVKEFPALRSVNLETAVGHMLSIRKLANQSLDEEKELAEYKRLHAKYGNIAKLD